ncbi:Hypothetical Protein FCC1311_005572 [Hondaea fermentalgiana]|uniref:Uncharacterized protein n=1 Tax=Hondaea fermentalgiana TaxID=2315210 RepID=A0A2R5G205_9STRA|nr:Hypothetical Protein FCC1311_005572 [Hondaea fermentalgiana]|eukprot:GBG24339.1 Hypothetical Protein FCC1311_005572 [Hondaea fermentalgiana]
MVSKPVALVGSGLSMLSAVMVVIVAVSENFVVVELPPVEACSETYLGSLGIFTATFDPACTVGSAAEDDYAIFEKSSGPVTSFWPLFPAQEAFGGALGIEEEFTTCEEFYAEGSTFETAAIVAGTSGAFDSLDTALTEQYTELTGTVDLVFGGIPLGLNTYINSEFSTQTVEGLEGVQSALNLAYNYVGAWYAGAAADSGCTVSGNIGTNALSAITISEVSSGSCSSLLTFSSGVALSDLFSASDGTLLTSIGTFAYMGAIGTPVTPVAALASTSGVNAATVESMAEALGLTYITLLLNQVDTLESIQSSYGGVYDITDFSTESLLTVKATVTGYDTTLRGYNNYNLSPLAQLLSFLCDGGIVSECPDIELDFPALNSTDEYPLCTVATKADLFNATDLVTTDAPDCTFVTFLKALATESVLSQIGSLLIPAGSDAATAAALLESLVTATPALQDALDTGALYELTLEQLATLLVDPGAINPVFTTSTDEQGVVPDLFNATGYGLCTGLALQGSPFECDAQSSFRSFILAAYEAANATGSESTSSLALANAIFNGYCASVQTSAECIGVMSAAFAGDLVDPTVSSALVAAVSTALPGGGATREERVAACEDDNTDKAKFETAQKMLISALVLIIISSFAGFLAGLRLKAPLVVVSGLFAVIGGGILLGALLTVQSAPVYAEVGGEKEDYETYYAAAVGQIIALVAVALAVVGGIVTLVSACLNRGATTESAVAGKVDTY